jgi:hypothetical protein
MNYIIKNDKLTVTIASFGAEIISVVKDGKERSWQNPTGEWDGHAPLLFPVCGRCGITLDGNNTLSVSTALRIKPSLRLKNKARILFPFPFPLARQRKRCIRSTLNLPLLTN